MSNSILNRSPFLRTSRDFPEEIQPLSVEIDRSYIDIANAVNDREIGLYTVSNAVLNGQEWFIQGGSSGRDGFRQVYTFTGAGNIAHGLNVASIYAFTHIYGTVQDSTGNWYPLPLTSTVNINQQISLQITSTNIVITAGAGAITISQGFIVLCWISSP